MKLSSSGVPGGRASELQTGSLMQPFSYWSADQLLVLTDWSTNSTSVAFFFFFFFSSAFVLKERIEQEVWSTVAPDWSFRTSYWNGCLINNPQTVSSWASWLVVEYDWLCCTHALAPASVHLSKWWMMWWVWWQCVGSDCSHQTSAKHLFGGRGHVRCSEPIMKPHLKAAFWSVPSTGQWQVFESEHLLAFFG